MSGALSGEKRDLAHTKHVYYPLSMTPPDTRYSLFSRPLTFPGACELPREAYDPSKWPKRSEKPPRAPLRLANAYYGYEGVGVVGRGAFALLRERTDYKMHTHRRVHGTR